MATRAQLSEFSRALLEKRWKRVPKKVRKELSAKMGRVSADRRKKYGWNYWKNKELMEKLKNE